MADNIYIYDEKIEMRRKYSAAEIEDLMTNSFSSDTNSDDESKQNFEVNTISFKEKSEFYR